MIKASIPGTSPLIENGVFHGPHIHPVANVNSDDRIDYTLSSFIVDSQHHRLIKFGKRVCTDKEIKITLEYTDFLHAWMVIRQATSLLRLAAYANRKTTTGIQLHKDMAKGSRKIDNLANE